MSSRSTKNAHSLPKINFQGKKIDIAQDKKINELKSIVLCKYIIINRKGLNEEDIR